MTIDEFIFEAMQMAYSEKLKELPPPPPGHYYAPAVYEIRREGENYVIDVEMTLKPVIEI